MDFIARHDTVFVVEQNRDAQLRTLLINEGDIDPRALRRVLHYDGTPITARFITEAIVEIAAKLKIVPVAQARDGGGVPGNDLSAQAQAAPSRSCRPTSSASRGATTKASSRRCAPAAATIRSAPPSCTPASS